MLYSLQCKDFNSIVYHCIDVRRRKKAKCEAGAIKVRRVSCNPHKTSNVNYCELYD